VTNTKGHEGQRRFGHPEVGTGGTHLGASTASMVALQGEVGSHFANSWGVMSAMGRMVPGALATASNVGAELACQTGRGHIAIRGGPS
jgi:hypothetical protein